MRISKQHRLTLTLKHRINLSDDSQCRRAPFKAFLSYFLYKEAGFLLWRKTGFLSGCLLSSKMAASVGAAFSFCTNSPIAIHFIDTPTHMYVQYINITMIMPPLDLVILLSILNPHDMIVTSFTGKITTLFLAPPLGDSPERYTKITPHIHLTYSTSSF